MLRVSTYPAGARFKFGDGRLGGVRLAADLPLVIAGTKGEFTAFALEADIPALFRKGVLEALRGQLGSCRCILTLQTQGVGSPLQVNRMGHYVLSAVAFGEGRPRAKKGPASSASYFEWAFTKKRPDLFNGGPRLAC